MTNKRVYLFISIALVSVMLFGSSPAFGQDAANRQMTDEQKMDDSMTFFLMQLQANIQSSLNDMDMVVADASHELSTSGLEGSKTRRVLDNLTALSPHFVEAVTISPEGKIIAAEPAVYNQSEGADISKQEAAVRLLKTRNPLLSNAFRLVEGFDAFIIAYPVFNSSGEFIGGISASVLPAEFFVTMIGPMIIETNYSVWVMQLDGLILYDPDPSQLGKNIFTDPMYQPYPQLLALGRRMVAERSGKGSYVFLTKLHEKNVTKEVCWTTVGLHGNEWRLAATRVAD